MKGNEEIRRNCSSCYNTRQGRGGLLCTKFGTLIHHTDMTAVNFKCKYYSEIRKKQS